MRIHRHQRVEGTSPKKGETPPTVKLQAKLQVSNHRYANYSSHTSSRERDINSAEWKNWTQHETLTSTSSTPHDKKLHRNVWKAIIQKLENSIKTVMNLCRIGMNHMFNAIWATDVASGLKDGHMWKNLSPFNSSSRCSWVCFTWNKANYHVWILI